MLKEGAPYIITLIFILASLYAAAFLAVGWADTYHAKPIPPPQPQYCLQPEGFFQPCSILERDGYT